MPPPYIEDVGDADKVLALVYGRTDAAVLLAAVLPTAAALPTVEYELKAGLANEVAGVPATCGVVDNTGELAVLLAPARSQGFGGAVLVACMDSQIGRAHV